MSRPADHRLRTKARSAGAIAAAASLALVACDSGPDSTRGGVSEGEASALDEAAEALDQQQTLPKGAVPPIELPTVEQAPEAADEPASETSGETSE